MPDWIKWFGRLGVALLLTGCAPPGELGERHQPSGLAAPLPTNDFPGYIAAAHQYIAAANQVAGRPLSAAAVENRGPFELEPRGSRCSGAAQAPDAKAVVLIHDLGGSPYVLRDLGRRLARVCYLVRAVLLPGHGGVPGDLVTVDYHDWREAVRRGVRSLAGTASQVSLVGFGLGGTLALDYALFDQPPAEVQIAALVLLAPMIREPASGVRAQAQRLVNGLTPKGGWRQLFPDDDPVGYESRSRNAELQRERLTLELVEQEEPLDLPVLMAISAEDATVDAGAARRWFCHRVSGRRLLLWYTSEPTTADDCDFVTERAATQSDWILGPSHIGLPVAPDNPVYGEASGYLSCLHYYWEQDSPSWFYCADPAKTPQNSDVRYGEISAANLRAHIIRRLTYNPDFDELAADIVAFLGG